MDIGNGNPSMTGQVEQMVEGKLPMDDATDPEIERIRNVFTYHRPFGTQPGRYEELRDEAKKLAMRIHVLCPHSREKSLAFTKLEEAIFWANAAIARNEERLAAGTMSRETVGGV